MTLLKRATDQTQSEWIPIPETMWRFVVGKPEVRMNQNFGKYEVKFPLKLTPTEQERLRHDYEKPSQGMSQSISLSYTPGLSLGWINKQGVYQSTNLVNFLSACLGATNTKKFRSWIESGGGPPRPADKDDDKAEIKLIAEWVGWWEGLEVLGTITHRTGKDGTVWADFAGPIAIGSLPGNKDNEYQAHGKGVLRSILVEAHPELADKPDTPEPVAAAPAKPRTYQEIFDAEEESELPF